MGTQHKLKAPLPLYYTCEERHQGKCENSAKAQILSLKEFPACDIAEHGMAQEKIRGRYAGPAANAVTKSRPIWVPLYCADFTSIHPRRRRGSAHLSRGFSCSPLLPILSLSRGSCSPALLLVAGSFVHPSHIKGFVICNPVDSDPCRVMLQRLLSVWIIPIHENMLTSWARGLKPAPQS